MKFWDKIEKLVGSYKLEGGERRMEDIFKEMDSYLKKCAKNSTERAENAGVYIPFEDFYSNYYFSTWQAIEDSVSISESTFKNIFLRRIYIAERKTWRQYKKRSSSKIDSGGFTYSSTCWRPIETLEFLSDVSPSTILNELEMDDLLKQFKEKNYESGLLIELLLIGYTSSEAALILGLGSSYDSKTRKKVQRIKDSFKDYVI